MILQGNVRKIQVNARMPLTSALWIMFGFRNFLFYRNMPTKNSQYAAKIIGWLQVYISGKTELNTHINVQILTLFSLTQYIYTRYIKHYTEIKYIPQVHLAETNKHKIRRTDLGDFHIRGYTQYNVHRAKQTINQFPSFLNVLLNKACVIMCIHEIMALSFL